MYAFVDLYINATKTTFKAVVTYGRGFAQFGETKTGEEKNAKRSELAGFLAAVNSLNIPSIIQVHCTTDYPEMVLTKVIEDKKNDDFRKAITNAVIRGGHKIVSWNDHRSACGQKADKAGFLQMSWRGKPVVVKANEIKPWHAVKDEEYRKLVAIEKKPRVRKQKAIIVEEE